MTFVVRFDTLPGKSLQLDEWLKKEFCPFWARQLGVKSCCVYRDVLVGHPERTLMVDIGSLEQLEKIIYSPEYARLKERLLEHASAFASQLVEATVCLPQAR